VSQPDRNRAGSAAAITLWSELTRREAPAAKPRRPLRAVRNLIWAYFWLLILEGVLRKWVVPSLSTPLLFIRDPIPVIALYLAIRERAVKRTIVVYIAGFLALAMTLAGFYMLPKTPWVVVYGFRCDFLHLLMIPLIIETFEPRDIARFTVAMIVVSVPVALLMDWQFHSAPNAWINSGVDGTFKQLDASQGHIRPPGPFTFTVGPALFYSLLAALIVGAAVDGRGIPRPLLLVGTVSLIVAAMYSVSRGLIGQVLIVLTVGLLGALVGNRQALGRYVGVAVAVALVALVVGTSSLMQESVSVFSTRVTITSQQEGGVSGILDRYFGDYVSIIPALRDAPYAGYGLGYGTNGGAAALTGSVTYLLAEREWPRVVYESGPVLGVLYILFRVSILAALGWQAFLSVRRGKVLAACLLGACGVNVIAGQFGQTTALGFTVLTVGLCFAAGKRPDEAPGVAEAPSAA